MNKHILSQVNLKRIYYFLILLGFILYVGIYYVDDFTSWQKGYNIHDVNLPFEYYYKYGMYPFKYYYLKLVRIILYLIWGLSLYFILSGIKVKTWIVNITYPIFIFLTCLFFSMLTLARVF